MVGWLVGSIAIYMFYSIGIHYGGLSYKIIYMIDWLLLLLSKMNIMNYSSYLFFGWDHIYGWLVGSIAISILLVFMMLDYLIKLYIWLVGCFYCCQRWTQWVIHRICFFGWDHIYGWLVGSIAVSILLVFMMLDYLINYIYAYFWLYCCT